ncbi:hypothetical protein LCGC14_2853150, partial [marine sediment metagenome]
MKSILIICFVLVFLPSVNIQATDYDFGFTGEFKENILSEFDLDLEGEDDIDALSQKKVKALTIGIKNYSKPDNPKYEIFDYYSYHWPGYS